MRLLARHPRFERLLWQVITAVAFVAVVALMLVRPAGAASPPGLDGKWRLVLALPGGELPVGLEIGRERGAPAAWLLNPPERLRVESIRIDGDRLAIAFPSYGSRLEATLGADGRLRGEAFLAKRSGTVALPLTGERAAYRFFAAPKRAAADLSGKWIVENGDGKRERGLAQFRQTGNRITGSVQYPSGDTRYLAGEVSGTTLALSTFDGNATSLWRATWTDGKLAGAQFGATGATGAPWTARRAGGETVAAVALEKPPVERIAFSFPGPDGRRVSLADPRYKGKVVVVTLGGTWCPNCHDEARFLGDYAARRARDGVEVIGLQFEYGDDPARSFKQIGRFAARYKLNYPLLLAGQPTPESSTAALPGIGGVRVYPTMLLIGRDGRLREIHVGWAGPATGALNVKAKREFDAAVSRLLRERV